MNHSIHSADRATHLKIVVLALVAGICVAGLGVSARANGDASSQTAGVVKAGKLQTTAANTKASVVR